MRACYFFEETYEELFRNITANVDEYRTNPNWVEELAQDGGAVKASGIDIDFPKLCEMAPEDRVMEDVANVKALYGSTMRLTPLQATNKFMWSALAHTAYRQYVYHRWFPESFLEEASQEEFATRVRRRFFVTDERRSLQDNAISRLWWYGNVSYDPNNKDNPFHLTEFLVSNTKFCTDFMQTPQANNFPVGKGVLLGVKRFSEDLGYGEGISNYYRALKKYLNRYSAVTSIDSLSTEEVMALSYEFLCTIRDRKIALPAEDEDDEAE